MEHHRAYSSLLNSTDWSIYGYTCLSNFEIGTIYPILRNALVSHASLGRRGASGNFLRKQLAGSISQRMLCRTQRRQAACKITEKTLTLGREVGKQKFPPIIAWNTPLYSLHIPWKHLLTLFIATPPGWGCQRNEGLVLLHSFLSLDNLVAFSILRFGTSAKSVSCWIGASLVRYVYAYQELELPIRRAAGREESERSIG